MDEFSDLQSRPDTLQNEAVFWTRQRIVYAVIAIIVIIAFLALILWPGLALWLNPPPPPPPTETLPRV